MIIISENKMETHLVLFTLCTTFSQTIAFRGGRAATQSLVTGNHITTAGMTTEETTARYLMDHRRRSMQTAQAIAPEQRLITDLFSTYNPEGRPIMDPSKPIYVNVDFFLMQINELDEKSQVLSTTGWLELDWIDEQLAWDPSEYDNVTSIVVSATAVWLPDVALDNTATKVYDLAHRADFRVLVNYNGTGSQVDISFTKEEVGLEYYTSNGEWDLIKTQVRESNFSFSCCPEAFKKINFILYLRRRSMFYMMNVLLPSLMISLLIIMVFILPPESGEKISLGTTLLLAFSVFQLLIADNMPQTSQFIPIISIYLSIFMGMTTLSIILSVLVLRIHHHGSGAAVPRWAKILILHVLARVLFMDMELYRKRRRKKGAAVSPIGKRKIYENPQKSEHIAMVHCNGPVIAYTSPDSMSLLEAIETDVNELKDFCLTDSDISLDQDRNHIDRDRKRQSVTSRVVEPKSWREEDAESQRLREETFFNADQAQVEHDWKQLARVVDRALLVLFIVLMLASTVYVATEIFLSDPFENQPDSVLLRGHDINTEDEES